MYNIVEKYGTHDMCHTLTAVIMTIINNDRLMAYHAQGRLLLHTLLVRKCYFDLISGILAKSATIRYADKGIIVLKNFI